MAISIKQYIAITSGVGGSNNVRQRDLILRIFSPNHSISPDVVLEFSNSDDVKDYFGVNSEEYKRAVKYFSYISPNIVSPKLISFARDQYEVMPTQVIGESGIYDIAKIRALNDSITIVYNDIEYTHDSIDLSNATSLSNAASIISQKIEKILPELSGCEITFNVLEARFEFKMSQITGAIVSFKHGVICDALGLTNGISIKGVERSLSMVESISQAEEISDNYGSFVTIRKLELSEVIEVAEDNAAKNVKFIYSVGCSLNDATIYSSALMNIAGVSVNIINDKYPDFDEQMPCTLFAATNYNAVNGTINYMFKEFSATAKVTDTATAEKLDALRINYYGQTQTAGQKVDFYQRGKLMGKSTSPTDANVYANEIWLKDKVLSALMTLQMSLGKISANRTGKNLIEGSIQGVVGLAINNGIICSNKKLNNTQKAYIAQITNEVDAWHKVSTIGYWLGVWIEEETKQDGSIEKKCVYLLVYSKDDIIRKVEGTHSLI